MKLVYFFGKLVQFCCGWCQHASDIIYVVGVLRLRQHNIFRRFVAIVDVLKYSALPSGSDVDDQYFDILSVELANNCISIFQR